MRGAADHLHSAAGVVRRGADRLDYLKRMAVLAIDDAEAAGFTVGEDLSLTDTRVFPVGPALQARQAQAEALAGEIHTRAAEWKAKWDAANHTRDGYNAVENSLNSSDGVRRYLSFIDDKGHAAVSIGNPDTAKRTATFVPGTGQDIATFGGSSLKSEKMFNATLQADRSLSKADVAVTTWMRYDRPMDLVQAASPDRAVNGGAALDAYLNGMHASHVGPAAIDTVIGHSYGSTLVGGAATGGNHLAADNVVAVGSPGMLAQHASDLSLDSGAHVFASRAEHDVIGVVTYATLGPDPMARQFGGIPFEAAPGPVAAPLGLPAPIASALGIPSVAAHSSYWDPGNPALTNMGRIIAGKLNVTPPTFTP